MKSFPFIMIIFFSISGMYSSVKLVGNGYEGVVVDISKAVTENPDLFKKLEVIFTDASAFLFRATKKQIYFKEFIFVVPEKWKTEPHYGYTQDLKTDKEYILIDNPSKANGNTPYVRYRGCGVAGIYLHLTPDYILNDNVTRNYGLPSKVMVHEWGHLRWGLFDEYPTTREERFYRFQRKWHPTKCSPDIDGRLMPIGTDDVCHFDDTTGKPDENCNFVPNANAPSVSSIMFMQHLENIVEFCDDADTAPAHLRHNKLAPNMQNKMCDHKSAWEVMREHKDFIAVSQRAPLPANTVTQPKFTYVQVQPAKRVLVLDTSFSMEGNPLKIMRQAVSSFILTTIEEGSYLGIVEFNTEGDSRILSHLMKIQSEADRVILKNRLPVSADGRTSIGKGLLLGQKVLSDSNIPSGGSIILITDGEENVKPFITAAVPVLKHFGIVVHAFAYGQKADVNISRLARDTGGKAFYYKTNSNSTALMDGLSSIVSRQSVDTTASVVEQGNRTQGSFYIDYTIGKQTTLTFSYTAPIKVAIESPDGPYKAVRVTDYESLKIIKIVCDDDLKTGDWSYHVTTEANASAITVDIQSKPRNSTVDVLQISSWISEEEVMTFNSRATLGVYALVTQGQTPILNASVIATVERPGNGDIELRLLDVGIGSDIIKDDGIYSGILIATDLTGNGRYNIKIKVVGTKDKTRVVVGGRENPGIGVGASEIPTDIETEPLENFQRVTTAGEFRVEGYTPISPEMFSDELPPIRITDLYAKSFEFDQFRATLEWTAVGGDMDRGHAARYIIYVSKDLEGLLGGHTRDIEHLTEEQVVRGNLASPKPPGRREEIIISLAGRLGGNETLYLSISAVDAAGNVGKTSNVITLSHAAQLSFPGGTTTRSESGKSLPIKIIMIVVGIIIVMLVVIVICYKIRKRHTIYHYHLPTYVYSRGLRLRSS